ncbi:MAG: glycine cleavage system aminomethyltransferase GcvT [Abitibacteriaceae bacterium]|nr:glycine cleavage system aminomethyltransferase GcvT [Abditibacteriaceae bacterium]MBV9864911.1 glycine cleavage system aminomethyltransferase GcvT [Abditibacteriaceae bacterium]
MNDLKRTALYDEHAAAGARLVPFAGWEMPVQYRGVIEEVRAVREGCGVFDVSHMGQLDVTGSDIATALNGVVSADWSKVGVGRVAYALLLNEAGGVIDDIMGYRLGEDEWMIVVNASRAALDEPHLQAHLPQLSIQNRYANQAMLAIQGVQAVEKLQPLVDGLDLSTMKWRDCQQASLTGAKGLLARGGYTGCDGFEFMFRAEDAPQVWRALLDNGVTPCGLGARDVLRLEAGLPLYGHELREEWTPQESGCAWAVKFDKGDFIGRAALEAKGPATQRIRGLKVQTKAIARDGYPVTKNGNPVGEVTSGTLSPTLGSSIALAMLPIGLSLGDTVEVVVRNAAHPAEIVQPPFVAHGKK